MTTTMTDTAALASIGAATRELRLPVVRAEGAHMAEVARAPRRPTWPSWPRSLRPRWTSGPNAAAKDGCTRLVSPA